MKHIIISILLLSIIGCAAKPTTTRYFILNLETKKLEEVARTEQKGEGSSGYNPQTGAMSADNRAANWWQKNGLPFFTGLLNRANRMEVE